LFAWVEIWLISLVFYKRKILLNGWLKRLTSGNSAPGNAEARVQYQIRAQQVNKMMWIL
jgi:hypothetical protein